MTRTSLFDNQPVGIHRYVLASVPAVSEHPSTNTPFRHGVAAQIAILKDIHPPTKLVFGRSVLHPRKRVSHFRDSLVALRSQGPSPAKNVSTCVSFHGTRKRN